VNIVAASLLRVALVPARVVVVSTLAVLDAPPVRRRVDRAADAGRTATERATVRLEHAAADALTREEVTRVIELTLQGPLPENLARSLVENQVPARMLRAALELREEQPLAETLDADVGRLLSSPAVRSALVEARTTAADEFVGSLCSRASALDLVVERYPRRWFRRPVRLAPSEGVAYPAGLVTRAVAFAVDLGIVTVVFAAGAAIAGAAASLVGILRPEWLVAAIGALAWSVVHAAYFAGSWTLVGQTPGMRLMRVRVVDARGNAPGVLAALVRWVGLLLSIVPCFAGFLPVLVDDRRRGLADLLARTTVESDP
jgi:uncharacterized RDD family membrane protein YckC